MGDALQQQIDTLQGIVDQAQATIDDMEHQISTYELLFHDPDDDPDIPMQADPMAAVFAAGYDSLEEYEQHIQQLSEELLPQQRHILEQALPMLQERLQQLETATELEPEPAPDEPEPEPDTTQGSGYEFLGAGSGLALQLGLEQIQPGYRVFHNLVQR